MDEQLHAHLRDLLKRRKFQEFNEQRPKGRFKFALPEIRSQEGPYEEVDFSDIVFDNYFYSHGQFGKCNFNGASFRNTNLDDANFGGMKEGCTFEGTDFYRTSLRNVRITPADLAKAKNIGFIQGNDPLVAAALAVQNQHLLAQHIRYVLLQEIRLKRDPLTDLVTPDLVEAERKTWHSMMNAELESLGDGI